MRCLLLLSLVLVLSIPARAETVYRDEQTLWQDTVWQGAVLVDGILTVAPGVTLEIRPGTTVRFTRNDSNDDHIGEHELFIQGTLQAIGTGAEPILFTSAEPEPQPGDWGAINMMASNGENLLEHCRIEYGYRGFHAHFATARLADSIFRYNRRGAQFQESTVDIVDSRFIDNLNGLQFRDSTVTISRSQVSGGYWGIRCVYTTLQLVDTEVSRNRINGVNLRDSEVTVKRCRIAHNRRGLYLQRTQSEVSDNVIEFNSEHGIFLEDSAGTIARNRIVNNGRAGFRVIDSPVSIVDNSIVDNDEYGLINDGGNDLDIRGNWWGTNDVEALQVLLRDGNDRAGVGMVRLTDPFTEAQLERKQIGLK